MVVNPVQNDMVREAVTERTLELALEDPKTILTLTPVSSPRHIPIITCTVRLLYYIALHHPVLCYNHLCVCVYVWVCVTHH